MATNTTNYNLVKPAENETADIGVINANMDIIDTTMKELDNSKESLIKNAAAKTTMVDADALPLIDSADGSKTKKLSFANLKILLKTIFATKEDITEVNTSLSNAIKKDGSVKMTGVLKTVGGTGAGALKAVKQLDLGGVSIYSAEANKDIAIVSNAYHDGTNWRYLNDGVASDVVINSANPSKPIYSLYAISGVKDGIIAWIENSPLTPTTGLPLTGGTLTGSIEINNSAPSVSLRDTDASTEYAQLILNGNTVHLQNVKSVTEYSNIRIMPYPTAVSDTLKFYKSGVGDYKIYGEHNITVSTSAPGAALAEGAQHQVY